MKFEASPLWVVVKFGGTSVASLDRWHNIVSILKQHLSEQIRPLVVCSAPSGISNLLEALCRCAAEGREYQTILERIRETYQALAHSMEIDFSDHLQFYFDQLSRFVQGISLLNEVSSRTQAQVMALGEIMLTVLGAAYLNRVGISTHWQDARELLLSADNESNANLHYLSAHCTVHYDEEQQRHLVNVPTSVVMTQGFIARNSQQETVLLGRGGSDTSAAYLSVLFNAVRCEIWTDVPGIYTANPHEIPEARLLKRLDYDEAQEIASMGGKILHPNCIAPLKEKGIPLCVKYTPQPNREGTFISFESDR